MIDEYVPTPVGRARITWYRAAGGPRAVALLGHGSATGVESPDLQALATVLPPRGITVGLLTQPYRVEGNRSATGEAALDAVWTAVWPRATELGVPVIAGGRSAGSQVACRTASALSAQAVLALAYPILGPGSNRELLSTGRPTLIVQGGRDPFGRPDQFPTLPPDMELVEIPSADHMFNTGPNIAHNTSMARITTAVTEWVDRQLTSHSQRTTTTSSSGVVDGSLSR
ncbi:putative alpha/beta-hydrolase family hydrolase [Nocardia sp. GAS34]|uniref:alpha/beta hydrolase family protein n=1 Tax=unclassified Nocardia TaxID=2637762 RepID=UPI003D21B23A